MSADMHRVGSVLVMVATIPLALRLAGDTYIVIGKITTSPTVCDHRRRRDLHCISRPLARLPVGCSLYATRSSVRRADLVF